MIMTKDSIKALGEAIKALDNKTKISKAQSSNSLLTNVGFFSKTRESGKSYFNADLNLKT
jgi:hypothetical protein